MAIVKKEAITEDYQMKEMKKFVAQTLDVMLKSKDVTLNVWENYDIVLVFSWERDYIKGAVYHWSTFNISKGRTISSKNKPLFTSRRFLKIKGKNEVFYDENGLKELTRKNLAVFYPVSQLVANYKVKATTNNRLKCYW